MAGATIKIAIAGGEAAQAELDKIRSGADRAAKSASKIFSGGGVAGAESSEQRAARLGRGSVIRAASRVIPQLAPMAEAASSAAPLAALGIAAAGAAVLVRSLTGTLRASIDGMESEIRTRRDTADAVRNARAAAEASALSSVMGDPSRYMRGLSGPQRAAMRATVREVRGVQRLEDRAVAERFMATGVGTARERLAETRAPEAVALRDAAKRAEREVAIQRELIDSMNGLQKAFLYVGNGLQGRSWDAARVDAERARNATTATIVPSTGL